ncbi:MAG: SDR family NAD(P)-dependent oxidoreductase, partial [Bacteroidales bacterium]|nr:SDR family NAD(P)-dependent oxidoreductase [Bacteroidales bacterium]
MVLNKRAIVTGGTRGIGRAIVKELATKSCCGVLFSDVAFIYNSCDECVEEIRREINSSESKIFGFKADASYYQEAEATVEQAVKTVLDRAPSRQSAQAKRDAAKRAAESAGSWPNPAVEVRSENWTFGSWTWTPL